jgi:uncharacterized membrane protein (DUF106 family)
MESHTFEIVMFILGILISIIGTLLTVVVIMAHNKITSMHEDMKVLQTVNTCDERHKANAAEHENLRKDNERNADDVRDLRPRLT